jgi:hypothetical protein
MKTLSMSGLEPNFGEGDSYFTALRAKKKAEAESYQKKVELSFDEAKVGKGVSEFFAAQLPAGRKIDKSKNPTDFTAVNAAFDDDDPRKALMPMVKQNYQALLRNKEFKGADANQLLSIAYEATTKGTPSAELEGASFEDDIHRYKYKQDTKPFAMGKNVAAAPGYDEWLANEKAKPMEDRQIGFAENAAWWTGAAAAGHALRKPVGEAIGRSLLKVGAEKAGTWMMRVAPPQGKLVGAVLAAAALSIPDTLASNAIRKTDWYRAREDQPIMRELAAMSVGGLVAGGAGMVGAKQGLGVLKAAAEKGAVSEATLKSFLKDTTAENIMRVGAARKAEKGALGEMERLLNNVASKDEKKIWFDKIAADEQNFMLKYGDDYAKESVIQMERNALREELILKSPVEGRTFGWGGEANQPTTLRGRATPAVRNLSNFEKMEPEFGWKGEGYTPPREGVMPPREAGFPRFEVYPEGVARQTNRQLELPAGNQLALPGGGPGQQALPASGVFGPKGQWATVGKVEPPSGGAGGGGIFGLKAKDIPTLEVVAKTPEGQPIFGLNRKVQEKIFTSLDTDEAALVIDRVTAGKPLSDVLFGMQQTRALKAALSNTEKKIAEASAKTTILPPDNVTGYVGSDAAAEAGKAGKILTLTQEVAEAKGELAVRKAAEQKAIQSVAKAAKKNLTDVLEGPEAQALLRDVDDPRMAGIRFFDEGKTAKELNNDARHLLDFFGAKFRTNNVAVPAMSPERTAKGYKEVAKPKKGAPKAAVKASEQAVVDPITAEPDFIQVYTGKQSQSSYIQKIVEDTKYGDPSFSYAALESKRIYNMAAAKGLTDAQVPNTQIFKDFKAAQEKAHFIRGEVLDPVVDDIAEFAGSSIADKGSLKSMIPIGAVGLTTVAAAIGLAPTDAEASSMTTMMKNVKALPKAWLHTVKELQGVKAIGHKQEMEMLGKVVKEMEEGGLVVKQVGNSKVLPARASVPNYATLAKELYGSLEAGVNKAASGLGFGFERIMSPYSRAQVHYRTGANPMVHLAHTQAIWNANTDNAFQTFSNIMKDVKGGQSAAREIIAEFKPLASKYSGVVETHNILTTKVKQGERAIAALDKALGKSKIDPEDMTRVQARKTALETELKGYRDGLTKADPEYQQYLKDHDVLTKKAAQKYPSTRVFLAAEDTDDFAHYPWLKEMLTVEERQAATHVKAMMKSYEEAVVSQGMNVITNRPYMHYSWHPDWHEARAAKYAESIGVDLPITTVPYNRFHSRTVGARALVPDAWHSIQSYVPMAEKTLGWNSFWNTKGPKGESWYKHMRSSTVQNDSKLRAMWNSVVDASMPARQTEVDKWANRYFNFEVFRLLAFSPSVAYKHLFKLVGTYASAGVRESGAHLPEAIKATGRKWVNNPELQKLANKVGIHPSKKGKFYDDVLRTYTYQARRSNILDDYELLPPSQIGWFDNMFQNLNHHAGFMTTAIESFDRTHQFITSASMAAKRGLTARDASYAVFDGILKDNFLGGVMNPAWAKSSAVRAVMLFQTTAFKILERRLITGIQTKRALSEVMKSVKGTDWTYDKVMHEMKALKDFVVKGEYEFKRGIITDALATERDFLGQFSARQSMRELVYAGVILGGGAAMGHDYAHHLNHFPFLGKSQDSEPLVGLSPIARGTWDTLHGKKYGGEESEFGLVGDFLSNWLRQQGPVPQMVSKTIKASRDDIPEMYREEGFLPREFRYFFAIPSTKEKE